MSEEEKKAKLKSLIEEYEVCYKESKYEGNVEEYKSLKETYKLLNDILNLIDRLQKELDKKDKILNNIKNELETELNFCNNENMEDFEKCSIQIHFYKRLLKQYFEEEEKKENG